jgi:hypothetical protein
MILEEFEDYPLWLGNSIIQNKLPWKEGLNISFKEFDELYTLHDSGWIGLFYDVGNIGSVILAIDWDVVWLPSSVKRTNSVIFLFIRIDKVKEISTSGYIDNNIPHFVICDYQVESIEEQKLLIISSCMGGDVEITFSGEVIFLALDRDCNVLKI